MPSSGLVWYIDGKLSPEIWIRRGLTYSINVYGGNNPHSAEYYNPLIITDEPYGGYERLSEQAQKHIKVLAGVQFTLRGQPRPTTGKYFEILKKSNFSILSFISVLVGPLCLAKHKGTDRRLDDEYPTFKKFNRSLAFSCETGRYIRHSSSFLEAISIYFFLQVNQPSSTSLQTPRGPIRSIIIASLV